MAIIRLSLVVAAEQTLVEVPVNYAVPEGYVVRVNTAQTFFEPLMTADPVDPSTLVVAVVGKPVVGVYGTITPFLASITPAVIMYGQADYDGVNALQGTLDLTTLIEPHLAVALDNRLVVAASLNGGFAAPRQVSVQFLLDVEAVKVNQEMAARISLY